MKKYIITEEQINEIFSLMKSMRMMKVKEILKNLEEFKSQSQKEQAGIQSVTLPGESSSTECSPGESGKASTQEAKRDKLATPSHSSKEEGGLKI